MSYPGNPDLDRPVAFGSGVVYYPYGGGAFRLAPFRCTVPTVDGRVAFQLDLVRALDERDSRAVLSFTLTADYASVAALQHVRTISAKASLNACVLTDWWFRVLPSAVLGAPVELTAPTMLASNGLGTARVMASMPLETGLVLESMLNMDAPLEGMAEAGFTGVSPRVPVAVRFESGALLSDLLKQADAVNALPRQVVIDYFSQDPSEIPLFLDSAIGQALRPRFAEAMTDRLVGRFGRYVPAHNVADASVVQFDASASSSITWALSQPFLATRRVALPVELLATARAQVKRSGPDSVIRRTTLTSLPSLGDARVTALCNLPVSRTGVDALGVTLTFPPRPPFRPQARVVTGTFSPPDDAATIDVRLSPGEPLRYRYAAFAVLTDEQGTRQLDGPELEGDGSPLHLSTEQFPIEFAVIEATTALAQLAIVSGVCVFEQDGVLHEQQFTLDSGNLSTGVAIPRARTSLTIDGYAIARDGSTQLRIGPFESPHVRLDVTSFADYGPQEIEIRCTFDDSAGVVALSFLPRDQDDLPENITTLSFSPAEPVRTYRWSSRTPFASGVRYRPFGVLQGGWTEATPGSVVGVLSSQLRKQERQRSRRLESVPAGPAEPESAVDAIGISPSHTVTDELMYDRISDPSKKLYVPRYALDVQSVSGQDRYRMSMSQRNGTAVLEVNLSSAPADALAEQARDAEAYPHRVDVSLDFKVSDSAGARKTLAFTEIARTDNLVKATLTFATMAERDDVYRALTEEGRDARLLVQRHLDVRVPERPPSGDPGPTGLHLLYALPLRPIHSIRPMLTLPTPPPVLTPSVVATAVLAAPAMTLTTPASMALATSLTATARGPAALRSRIESAPARRREATFNPRLVATPIATNLVLRHVGRFSPTLSTPQLTCSARQEEQGQTRCTLSVTNWAEFSDDFFVASPDLPPVGQNKAAPRTIIHVAEAESRKGVYSFGGVTSAKQLLELSFAVPSGKLPGRLHVTFTDRRTKVQTTSNAVETSAPGPSNPPTRDLRMQLDQAVSPAPFAFPAALHGYMFQGITPTTGSNQLIRYRLPWKGTFHTYLQDASRPHEVYVFPDQFKMARRPDPPFTPFATVRVSSRADASETDVVFDYVVAPSTNPKRLADARTQLLADARFGADSVKFQPFLTSDVRFFIDRPAMEGAVRQERPDASVVLQGWLKDTLAMPLGDFRLLFDAMHRRTASLFIGRVEIDVPNHTTEVIPFAARMDDLAGEVFSYEITPSPEGELQVTARNEIESPLNVQAIDATITSAGQTVRGLVQGGGVPAESLAPGSTLQFTVRPERALPSSTEPEIEFDLGGVLAIPDPETIFDSILDRTTVEYFRIVTVKAIATLFEPVAGREAERIVNILLEFEGGGTGELAADALEAKVRVDHPIDDVMLGRPVSPDYRYTVTVIRADGRQDRDASPREGSAATFFVSVIR